jgi:hypothetical protein
MIPEDVDLERMTAEIHEALRHHEPVGYLRGKALMRDVLVHRRRISELEAEELIDTLELRGFLQFLGDPSERSEADSHWNFNPR